MKLFSGPIPCCHLPSEQSDTVPLPRSQQAPVFSLQPHRSEVFLLREESRKQGSWLKVLRSSEDKEVVRGAESILDIN